MEGSPDYSVNMQYPPLSTFGPAPEDEQWPAMQ